MQLNFYLEILRKLKAIVKKLKLNTIGKSENAANLRFLALIEIEYIKF
jgi:hypothetical protein